MWNPIFLSFSAMGSRLQRVGAKDEKPNNVEIFLHIKFIKLTKAHGLLAFMRELRFIKN